MKQLPSIFIILLIACTPGRSVRFPVYGDKIYGKIAAGIPERDSLIINTGTNGDTLSLGRYAITEEGNLSNFKTGYWKHYSDNGRLKEEGKYKMGAIVDCCTAGHCMTYYHYKIGTWKYYDTQGSLLFQVYYKPKKLHIDTRCKGGDLVTYGLIKNPSNLKELHNLSSDSINALQMEFIEDDYKGVTILTPSNGKLIVNYKIKE